MASDRVSRGTLVNRASLCSAAPTLIRGADARLRWYQSDFHMIAPMLVRLLGEFPALILTVAGDFDLGQFPEFTKSLFQKGVSNVVRV